MRGGRHVHTLLDATLHDTVKALAKKRGQRFRAALEEALRLWVGSYSQITEDWTDEE